MNEQSNHASDLALYYNDLCGFCHMVKTAMAQLNITMEMRDTLRDPANRRELIQGGGRGMIPCLRIDLGNGEYQWMYESADIIRYLRNRFSPEAAQSA